MIQPVLQIIFVGWFYLTLAAAFLVVISSSWSDLKTVKTRQQLQSLAGNLKHQPITVVVLADNHATSITACLQSIARTRYRALTIIVIDNASKDGTVKQVRQFLSQHSNLTAKVIAKRRVGSRVQLLAQVKSRLSKDTLVLTLDGDAVLKQDSLGVVNKLFHNPEARQYYFWTVPHVTENFVSVAHSFLLLSTMRAATLAQCTKLPARYTQKLSFACRSESFAKPSKPIRRSDLSELVAIRRAPQANLRRRGLFLPAILLQLITIAAVFYYAYVAVVFGSSQLLIYSFAVTILWLAYVTASAACLKAGEKRTLLSVLPTAYVLLLVTTLIGAISSVFSRAREYSWAALQMNKT